MQPFPKTVVGVLVFKDGKVLLGRREKGDGKNEYAGPGGHLRFGETLEECATRKVREETGIIVTNVKIVSLLNALHWAGSHYIDIEAVANWQSGEPQVLSEEIHEWNWYGLEELPQPLIIGDCNGLESIRTGKFYYGSTHP